MSVNSESALRARAKREGYRVRKSRRSWGLDYRGEYMLLDLAGNYPVLGFRYDASLDEIAGFLAE